MRRRPLEIESRVKSSGRAHLAMPARSEAVDQQHDIAALAQYLTPGPVKRGQLARGQAHHPATAAQPDQRRKLPRAARAKQAAFKLGCRLPRTVIVGRAEMHDSCAAAGLSQRGDENSSDERRQSHRDRMHRQPWSLSPMSVSPLELDRQGVNSRGRQLGRRVCNEHDSTRKYPVADSLGIGDRAKSPRNSSALSAAREGCTSQKEPPPDARLRPPHAGVSLDRPGAVFRPRREPALC